MINIKFQAMHRTRLFSTTPLLSVTLRHAGIRVNNSRCRKQYAQNVIRVLGCRTIVQAAPASCSNSKDRNTRSPRSLRFWSSGQMWRRSAINTFRCLVGCTSGDFATMFYLQSAYPELSVMLCMGLSMAAGITTSIVLETSLLHWGKDRLEWKAAFGTATGMSMISMLAMEAAENAVDYSLTGGAVNLESPYFWGAAGMAMAAGFLVPLPYNYFRLRAYNRSCH